MKIKKIALNNFRQFIGEQSIEFACDNEKNITFILAKNTAGKTTIIEAFSFVFYGNATNDDFTCINNDRRKKLGIGGEETVRVIVDLQYMGIDYEIKRERKYRIEQNKDSIVSEFFNIRYKDTDGVSTLINGQEAKDKINEIMPERLFKYFFFEGEDIERLGDNIKTGGEKSNEFKEAIRSILGFKWIYSMLGDLQNIIKHYEKDLQGCENIGKENKKILEEKEKLEKELDNNRKEKVILENNLAKGNERKKYVDKIIQENTSVSLKEKEVKELKNKNANIEIEIYNQQRSIFKEFSKNAWGLYASKLYEMAKKTLESEDKIDKGIPGLDADCIKYIMSHHECICGAKVLEDSKAFLKLQELLDYIPPRNIGSEIRSFINEIENREMTTDAMIESIKKSEKNICDLNVTLVENTKKIANLEDEILGHKDISNIKAEQIELEKNINEINRKIGELNNNLDHLEQDIKSKEKELVKGSNHGDDKINYINRCILYAKYENNRIIRFIKKREKDLKVKLEGEINNIFNKTFDLKHKLMLDDDYTISIIDGEKDITAQFGLSGAQNVMLAFAFIAAVTKIAVDTLTKNNDNENDEIEPYPLIMDAPTSNFDEDRIESFSNYVPRITEQAIFLIKDTDGKHIEKHLENKIGKRYILKKIDASHTDIEEC